MTVRLSVDRARWDAHVTACFDDYGEGLVPVVKGNGYGFGRNVLHSSVTGSMVCVGTIHELADVPPALTSVVLTPTLTAPVGTRPILTVGSVQHVHALAGWRGSVVVKLASSMRRYGATPADLPELLAAIQHTDLQVAGFGIHLALASDDDSRLAEIEAWLPRIPTDADLWVSHLRHQSFRALVARHADRRFLIRVGTELWHGIPRADHIHLSADVLQVQPVRRGERAGYYHSPVPFDGTLVAIGAGSTHGMAPLAVADPERQSPFHFQRQRLTLLERPHMHTSLVIVADGHACPNVGDWVDVQRPLITTQIDELRWT